MYFIKDINRGGQIEMIAVFDSYDKSLLYAEKYVKDDNDDTIEDCKDDDIDECSSDIECLLWKVCTEQSCNIPSDAVYEKDHYSESCAWLCISECEMMQDSQN